MTDVKVKTDIFEDKTLDENKINLNKKNLAQSYICHAIVVGFVLYTEQ